MTKKGQALLAKCYNCEGLILKSQGKYEDALIVYKRARKLTKECYEEDHIAIATVLYNIALVQKNFGEFDKALNNLKRCAEIEIKWYGEESEIVERTKETIDYVAGFCTYDAKRAERAESIWSNRNELLSENLLCKNMEEKDLEIDENENGRQVIESALTENETNLSAMSFQGLGFGRKNKQN